MSKAIKVTEEEFKRLKDEFEKELKSGKWDNGKVSFQSTLGKLDRKATLVFTDIAWLKMQGLISEFNSEVGWHGIARRGDRQEDEYIISDILVYPQEVTGVTVTTDQKEYNEWLNSQDDEVFNNIRMQGHSHVNMSTTPSGTDLTLYKEILDQLEDNMFYIFLIWNKSGQKTILIYDMQKNVLFETADIEVEVENNLGYFDFIKEAKKLVKTKTSLSGYDFRKTTDQPKGKKKQSRETAQAYNPVCDATQWDPDWDDDYEYCGFGRRVYR